MRDKPKGYIAVDIRAIRDISVSEFFKNSRYCFDGIEETIRVAGQYTVYRRHAPGSSPF